MDYGAVTSTNPDQNSATGHFTLTVTDNLGNTSQANGNTRPTQPASVMVFGQANGLQGTADLTKIKSVTVDWFPGSNQSNFTQVIDIEKLWTLNPNATAPQAITFTSTAPNPGHVGGTYTVTATGGGSGNPVTFSVGPGTTAGACTVSGSTVSFLAVGTCVVAANQAGNGTFDPAPQVTQTITVGKTAQAINFTSTAPNPGAIGGTYTVTANGGGSGNPVTFSLGAGTTNSACTVAGSTVSFAHAGTCVVAANQAGNGTFDPAPQVTQTITVAKTAQAITFTSTPPNPGAIGGTYTVTANGGGSGNPVTFSLGAGTTNGACTVAGSTVSFAHAGTCVVAADQAGNADFDDAPQKTQTITVAKNAQTITFTSTPPSPASSGTTYTVAALGGGSGSPVTFSTAQPGMHGGRVHRHLRRRRRLQRRRQPGRHRRLRPGTPGHPDHRGDQGDFDGDRRHRTHGDRARPAARRRPRT